jgi:hypothetical protein
MTLARLDRPLAWATIGALLVLTVVVLERRVSWYLSVDQFGYLTFAGDLLHGRVFHHWAPAWALEPALEARTDMLSQTYVWDHGRLSSRYAPGFPLLLAACIGLLGDDAGLYLNLVLFMVLLAVLVAFQTRIARLAWAGMALALAVLSPSSISLWATTLSRDVAAHLFAFAGLLVLLPHAARTEGLGPRTTGAAAGLLGFAASVRPDAVLYLVPAAALMLWRRAREPARASIRRTAAAALAGLLVGLAPSLAYNALVLGNPLRSTQGMELDHFFAALIGPPAAHAAEPWHGTTHTQVAGNALRLVNLPRVLPENLSLLWEAHGPALSALALWGVAVAAWRRSPLAVVALAYTPVALVFYSCWDRPEIRYLFGVALLVPLLVVEGSLGTLALVDSLRARGRAGVARSLAGVAVAGGLALAVFAPLPAVPTSALHGLAQLVPTALAVAAAGSLVLPRVGWATLLAPFLAVTLTIMTAAMAWPGLAFRAPFQGAEMRRARAVVGEHIPAGAVVISSEDIGRPAENIGHYTGAHALYLTDLERWHLSVRAAVKLFLDARMEPYLLLPESPELQRILFEELRDFAARLVASVPPERNPEWFVVSHYHHGLPLKVYRIARAGTR